MPLHGKLLLSQLSPTLLLLFTLYSLLWVYNSLHMSKLRSHQLLIPGNVTSKQLSWAILTVFSQKATPVSDLPMFFCCTKCVHIAHKCSCKTLKEYCVDLATNIRDAFTLQSRWTWYLFRNYNPKDGRRGKPISKEEAMKELIEVVSNWAQSWWHKHSKTKRWFFFLLLPRNLILLATSGIWLEI